MVSIDNKWSHCFRARRDFLYAGLGVTLLNVFMACFSFWAWCNQPPNDPVNMPGVISLFLAFITLGFWLLLFYIRYRLNVNDAGLFQVGVIARKQIRFADVKELKWREVVQVSRTREELILEGVERRQGVPRCPSVE